MYKDKQELTAYYLMQSFNGRNMLQSCQSLSEFKNDHLTIFKIGPRKLNHE